MKSKHNVIYSKKYSHPFKYQYKSCLFYLAFIICLHCYNLCQTLWTKQQTLVLPMFNPCELMSTENPWAEDRWQGTAIHRCPPLISHFFAKTKHMKQALDQVVCEGENNQRRITLIGKAHIKLLKMSVKFQIFSVVMFYIVKIVSLCRNVLNSFLSQTPCHIRLAIFNIQLITGNHIVKLV